jgi:hypothetical protein
MPKGSVAAKVESKLKKEYPGNPHAVYGTLNKAGLMHGNKTTAKGAKPARRLNFKKSSTPSIAL